MKKGKLTALFLTVFVSASAFAQQTISTAAVDCILKGNWGDIMQYLPAVDTSNARKNIVPSYLAAHHLYAMQEYNLATFYFYLLRDSASVGAWREWTAGLAAGHPQNSNAQLLYGDALARASLWKESLVVLNTAVSLDPSNYLARMARGVVYDILDNVAAASDDFQKCTALRPDFADAYISQGVADMENNNKPDATHTDDGGVNSFFEQGLRLCPRHALGWNGRFLVSGNINNTFDKSLLDSAFFYSRVDPFIRQNYKGFIDSTLILTSTDSLKDRGFENTMNFVSNTLTDFNRYVGGVSLSPQRISFNPVAGVAEMAKDLGKLAVAYELPRGGIYFKINDKNTQKAGIKVESVPTEFSLAYPRPGKKELR